MHQQFWQQIIIILINNNKKMLSRITSQSRILSKSLIKNQLTSKFTINQGKYILTLFVIFNTN